MKRRIVLIILSSVFVFSCGDDDDKGFPEKLVGAWSSSAFSRTDCTDSDDNASCDSEGCMVLTFSADGSYAGAYPDVTLLGVATGDETSLSLCAAEGCTDVDYTLVSGSLSATWTDSEDGCKYKVTMTK